MVLRSVRGVVGDGAGTDERMITTSTERGRTRTFRFDELARRVTGDEMMTWQKLSTAIMKGKYKVVPAIALQETDSKRERVLERGSEI